MKNLKARAVSLSSSRLVLAREGLRRLSAADLGQVAGGGTRRCAFTNITVTCPSVDICPSLDYCPTEPA